MKNSRYALVTGSSKGIGKAIARELAIRGRPLILSARSGDLLDDIAEDWRKTHKVDVRTYPADLADTGAPAALHEWCRKEGLEVDVLVNNAGFGVWDVFHEADLEALEALCELNMRTVLRMCHAFLPMLREQPKAWVLNVGSTGAYQPVPYMAVYGASKAFVRSFTRALRDELRDSNVSVTVLNPGGVWSDFTRRAKNEAVAQRQAKFMMEPETCARAAVRGMFRGKAEIVPGWYNRVGAFLTKHFPLSLSISAARKIFSKEDA